MVDLERPNLNIQEEFNSFLFSKFMFTARPKTNRTNVNIEPVLESFGESLKTSTRRSDQ